MTPLEWASIVDVLRSVYYTSFKLDSRGIEAWYNLLKDLPGERVMQAAAHMCKNQAAFPSVADLRRLAEPAPADPGDAWRQACDYVTLASIGPKMLDGQLVEPDKPEPWIMAALESVGMEAIRHRTPDTEGTLRAHFIKFYNAKVEQQREIASGLRPAPTPKAIQGATDEPLRLSVGELTKVVSQMAEKQTQGYDF